MLLVIWFLFMKDRFGEDVKFRSFDRKRSLFQRFGAQLVQGTYEWS